MSWNEAARFVNWLNTSTGEFAAYHFAASGVNDNITPWTASDTLDYDASNPYRSVRTNFVLPSMDEWYKAASYDPTANAGAGGSHCFVQNPILHLLPGVAKHYTLRNVKPSNGRVEPSNVMLDVNAESCASYSCLPVHFMVETEKPGRLDLL